MNEIKNLKPFPKFCCSIGYIPTSYKISMTYEEQLLWLCDFLENTVIPTVNQNGQAVEELQNLYVELKQYVDDYFENLDIQTEINNKLDDMVEQGTLQEIIADYLNSKAVFGFDTVADMKEATNLINGSYAETMGYYEKNDGGSALYKISNTLPTTPYETLNSGLYAELIVKDKIINIKQIGAKSNDSTFDNAALINNILNIYNLKCYIPKETFYINNSILPINGSILKCDGTLNYTGNESAIIILASYVEIDIRNLISSSNGITILTNTSNITSNNIIKCDYITSSLNGIQLISEFWGILDSSIYFEKITAGTNNYGIYLYSSHSESSSHPSYIGEIRIFGGRIDQGLYGIYAKSLGDSPQAMSEITGLKFYNISIEGSTNGIYFDNVNYSVINYPRYQELEYTDPDIKIFTFVNNTRNCVINGTSGIAKDFIDVSQTTNTGGQSNIFNFPIKTAKQGFIGGKSARSNNGLLFYEPIYKYQMTTIGTSSTLLDLRNAEVLPTYIRCNSTNNITIYLDTNYSLYGITDLYINKVNSGNTLTILDYNGNNLYTINTSGIGFYHFAFNQDGYFVVINH